MCQQERLSPSSWQLWHGWEVPKLPDSGLLGQRRGGGRCCRAPGPMGAEGSLPEELWVV